MEKLEKFIYSVKYLPPILYFGTIGLIGYDIYCNVINETELINYIENKKVSFAGLDTFENEPTPSVKLLMHPKISLSPHIGAATSEAQDRIGIELADQIINYFNND